MRTRLCNFDSRKRLETDDIQKSKKHKKESLDIDLSRLCLNCGGRMIEIYKPRYISHLRLIFMFPPCRVGVAFRFVHKSKVNFRLYIEIDYNVCYNAFNEVEFGDINSCRNLRYVLRTRYIPLGWDRKFISYRTSVSKYIAQINGIFPVT